MCMSLGTLTEPAAHTRPRSLRMRSTIIKFSAIDFSSVRRAIATAASSAGVAPRAAVPLMGLHSTARLRSTRMNRSGEEQQITTPPGPMTSTGAAGIDVGEALGVCACACAHNRRGSNRK